MFKTLGVFALVAFGFSQMAFADGAPCPGSTAAAPAIQAPVAKAPAPAVQAQRPQAARSYSYSPSANYNYARPQYNGMRWNNMRPAYSKALGNY
jgi:hypothetical protein